MVPECLTRGFEAGHRVTQVSHLGRGLGRAARVSFHGSLKLIIITKNVNNLRLIKFKCSLELLDTTISAEKMLLGGRLRLDMFFNVDDKVLLSLVGVGGDDGMLELRKLKFLS